MIMSTSASGRETTTMGVEVLPGRIKMAIIDDAFAPPMREDFGPETLEAFWQDISESPSALAQLKALGPTSLKRSSDLDDQLLCKLFAEAEHVDEITPFLDRHLRPLIDIKRGPLDLLVSKVRNELQWECSCLGKIDDTLPDDSIHIFFIDYYFGPPGQPQSIIAAKNYIDQIKRKYVRADGQHPLFVLMSSTEITETERIKFREDTGLIGGVFLFIPKSDFGKEIIKLKLASLAASRLAASRIQHFVEALEQSITDAGNTFLKALKSLSIEDYGYIHSLCLLEEAQPLGDYMLSLFSSYIGRLLFEHEAVKTRQLEVDRISFKMLPPTQTKPSDLIARMYQASVCHIATEDLNHPQSESRPSVLGDDVDQHPYVHLGDLFWRDASGEVWVIVTPQCDLVFGPTSKSRGFRKDRSVHLVPGKLQRINEPLSDQDLDRPRTEIFVHQGIAYRILWDVKRLKTVEFGKLWKWLNAGSYVRVARLRLSFALEVQHAVTASLSRVGTPVAPPMNHPVKVELCCVNPSNGRTAVLTSEDQGAFLFIMRNGKQFCVLKEEAALKFSEFLAVAKTDWTRRLTALEARSAAKKNVDAALDACKKNIEKLSTEFSNSFALLERLREPFLVPLKEPGKLKGLAITVVRGWETSRNYSFDTPLVFNIVIS